MTLVLAYVNRDFAVMAADRRITVNGVPKDDRRAKIVDWENHLLIGFTGLAEIGSRRQETMEWLARQLAATPGTIDFEAVAAAATREVAATRVDRGSSRLTFIACGYDPAGEMCSTIVSNMYDDDLNVTREARDELKVLRFTAEEDWSVHRIGAPMPEGASAQTAERLSSAHVQQTASPRTVSEILAGAVEAAAGTYVSRTCLIATITRDGGATFDVVTPSSKPGQTVDLASPYFVAPGGAVMVMPSQPLRRAKARP